MRPKLHRAAIRRFGLRIVVLCALAIAFFAWPDASLAGLDPMVWRSGILFAVFFVAAGPLLAGGQRRTRARATLPRSLAQRTV